MTIQPFAITEEAEYAEEEYLVRHQQPQPGGPFQVAFQIAGLLAIERGCVSARTGTSSTTTTTTTAGWTRRHRFRCKVLPVRVLQQVGAALHKFLRADVFRELALDAAQQLGELRGCRPADRFSLRNDRGTRSVKERHAMRQMHGIRRPTYLIVCS
uniref:Uncharacterized protein n=1 Tax=Anopheles coluzzii TaxID=1518534 RepID=A0A8W7PBB9_ANOCL